MNEETTNVKFRQSKFENYVSTKSFSQQILSLQRARLILVSRSRTFQITIMLFLLIDFPQKLTFERTHGILITFFYINLFLFSPTKDLLSSLKNQKNYS